MSVFDFAYNLGTGRGTSVLEMVAAFEKASGKKIPVKLCAKRPGDATVVYASTEKTEREKAWVEVSLGGVNVILDELPFIKIFLDKYGETNYKLLGFGCWFGSCSRWMIDWNGLWS